MRQKDQRQVLPHETGIVVWAEKMGGKFMPMAETVERRNGNWGNSVSCHRHCMAPFLFLLLFWVFGDFQFTTE